MERDETKTAKAVEAGLQNALEHSDALGKALDEAERKHPVEPRDVEGGEVV